MTNNKGDTKAGIVGSTSIRVNARGNGHSIGKDSGNYITGEPVKNLFGLNYGHGTSTACKDNWRSRHNAKRVTITRRSTKSEYGYL